MNKIKIFLKNVYSVLSDYTTGLEERLTVAYPNYWFSPKFKHGLWDGKNHFLKVPSLKFPTGLLFIVEEYFKEKNMEYEIDDLRSEPIITPKNYLHPKYFRNAKKYLHGITLRDYQMEAINKGLMHCRGIFEVATGLGKTEIACGITKALGLRTIFMTHTQDLLHQTIERFESRLDRKGKIGIIGDGRFEVDSDIVIAMIQSLDRRLFEKNKQNRSVINKKTGVETKQLLNTFNIMFQDETHHSSAATWYRMGMFMHNAHYRFGLSGTPLKRDVLSNMKVMAITGDVIYSKLAEEGIEEGYLSGIEVRIVDAPEDSFLMSRFADSEWQEIYDKAIVNSSARNDAIIDLAEKEFKLGKKILILVRIIEHGEILKRMLAERKIDFAFIHGGHGSDVREEVKKNFNEKGDFVLIASPIYDEGVDLPEVNVLIKASGGKSEVKTIQHVGRGLRPKKENLIVYDFYDHSKYLEEHSQERIRVYKQEGFLK